METWLPLQPTGLHARVTSCRSAGQLIKIDVLDHIIMGQPSAEQVRDFVSLRDMGNWL